MDEFRPASLLGNKSDSSWPPSLLGDVALVSGVQLQELVPRFGQELCSIPTGQASI